MNLLLLTFIFLLRKCTNHSQCYAADAPCPLCYGMPYNTYFGICGHKYLRPSPIIKTNFNIWYDDGVKVACFYPYVGVKCHLTVKEFRKRFVLCTLGTKSKSECSRMLGVTSWDNLEDYWNPENWSF